jgi:hypothetical protein
VSKKYGTPRCEFIVQLLRVDESSCGGERAPLWVGAHPRIGEDLAEAVIRQGLLAPKLPLAPTVQREVTRPCGADMRADFLLDACVEDGKKKGGKRGVRKPKERPIVLEVKSIVDSDYPARSPPARTQGVWLSSESPYRRAAVFPWGRARQKGPDGEKCVSARAIKHIDELARIAAGKARGEDGQRMDAAALFLVLRHDCTRFRPNEPTCPSFAQHLRRAQKAGVQCLAYRVRWGNEEDGELGQCFADGEIPVVL